MAYHIQCEEVFLGLSCFDSLGRLSYGLSQTSRGSSNSQFGAQLWGDSQGVDPWIFPQCFQDLVELLDGRQRQVDEDAVFACNLASSTPAAA
jgi:hypothetical protein